MIIDFNGIVSFSLTANDTPTDLLVELNKASTITVKKSWFSFNKSYKVYVDDELVGKIEGLYFNIFEVI